MGAALLVPRAAHAQVPLVLAENMAVLHAGMPNTSCRFLGSNAPGQLFLPGEVPTLRIAFTKGTDNGTVRDFALELQEITTRDPEKRITSSMTDAAGAAPLIGLEGQPIRVPIGVTFTAAPETEVSVPGFPLRRDRLQVAFDTNPGWHDLKPIAGVPVGFHTFPDTDCEYSIYGVAGWGNEVWRYLAPGLPRINDWPHQPRGPKTTGLVPAAQSFVRRDGNTLTYEVAIPRSELADLKLAAGTNFGFSFVVGNSDGPKAEYGLAKALAKQNGLTMHPYRERHPSDGVCWTLTN